MLKKKNIAMVMAAATVATSVAPVFALESQNVEEAALVKEVGDKLAVKYTATPEESVYKVMVAIGSGSASPVTTVQELEKKIEKAKVEGEKITVEIMDKGHKEVDGKIVAKVKSSAQYIKADLETSNEFNGVAIDTIKTNSKGVVTNITLGTDTATITLASKEEIVVVTGGAELDLTKGLDKDGNKIDIAKIANNDTETAKRVVGFEVQLDDNASDDVEGLLPGRNISKLVCLESAAEKKEFKLEEFKTENGFTQAGKELVELLRDCNVDSSKTTSVINNGKRHYVKFAGVNALKLDAVKDGGYQLTVDLMVGDSLANVPAKENVQLVISSNIQKDLADLQTLLSSADASTVISVGKYEKIAGDNRFETAVEISKKSFGNNGGAQAIVLVGENAVVDGLAAAPLAKKVNAPILFTKKDSVPASTMNEIKRAAKDGATVYVIGGENTISKEVESELGKINNFKTLRLKGDDRHETSLKIAEELGGAPERAFVVGGNGLADAMSIAPVAANAEQPIIVTPAEGLTKDAKTFIDSKESIVTVDVVGGQTRVSTQVLKDLNAMKQGVTATAQMTRVERISGSNKNETNATVINEYFSANKLQNVYVSKDADAMLVDALAVAPLAAGSTIGTPDGAIVLATNDLTASQEKAIKDNKKTSGSYGRVQVGNGIASTVMQKVLKALDIK